MRARLRMRTATARAVGLGLCLVAGAARPRAEGTLQDKVEAAMVSKFPQFVEWPPAALTGRSTIDLCIVSADPIQADLEELVAAETLDGRSYAVRRVQRDQDVDGCHVLFMRGAALASNAALLRRARNQPVLTVGDDQKFLDAGGIVRLRQVSGRLRFDVNAAAAKRAGLRLSSQLLQLAVSVRGGPA